MYIYIHIQFGYIRIKSTLQGANLQVAAQQLAAAQLAAAGLSVGA